MFRLQRGSGGECAHFQRMAAQGHYGRGGGTRQGIYVSAPSGKLLASANTLNAEKVLELLDAGWAAWEALPETERHLSPMDFVIPEPRWEDNYPVGGLALRSTIRDLGKPDEPVAPGARLNADFVWFTPEEARSMLPVEPQIGAVHALPRALVSRLVRLHLVDNVRGQTIPFSEDEIEHATCEFEVMGREGARLELELRGESVARSDGIWRLGDSDWGTDQKLPRSVEASWQGSASFDLATGRFTHFDMVAFGEREGRGSVNNRHKDPGRSRLGWVFELAEDTPANRISPTFIDHYDVAWVERPPTAGAPLWIEPSD